MKTVAAAIIKKSNKILIARRASLEKLAGYWEFPGGKQEANESIEKCLERELYEELNIRTKSGRILTTSKFKYEHGEFIIVAIESKVLSGKIKLNVHDKIEYVDLEQLLNYKILPADIEIIKHLKNGSVQ